MRAIRQAPIRHRPVGPGRDAGDGDASVAQPPSRSEAAPRWRATTAAAQRSSGPFPRYRDAPDDSASVAHSLTRIEDLHGLERWWTLHVAPRLPHDWALLGEARDDGERFEVASVLIQHGALHEDAARLLPQCSVLLAAWRVMERACVLDLGPCVCLGKPSADGQRDATRRFLVHARRDRTGMLPFVILSAPSWPDEAGLKRSAEDLMPLLHRAVRRVDERRLTLPAESAHPPLTPREREIVAALRRGLTNKEIARSLGTSPNTVRNQIAHLAQRVGARGRAQLVSLIGRDD